MTTNNVTLSPEIDARLKVIATNPLADMSVEEMTRTVIESAVNPHLYCDLLELQFALTPMLEDFMEKFHARAGVRNQALGLAFCARSLGVALSLAVRKDAIPGAEVASELLHSTVENFANFFAMFLNVKHPPAPDVETEDKAPKGYGIAHDPADQRRADDLNS